MDEILDIPVPVARCPKCGAPINGPIYYFAVIPPIHQYPCGCKVRFVEVSASPITGGSEG